MERISRSLLILIFLVAVVAPIQMASAQDLCVNVAHANLRAGPSTDEGITWIVNQYMPLNQVERKGNWYQVMDVDGDRHWIFHTLVNSQIECVIIKAERANVHKGPGTDYAKWFTVERYTTFKKIGEEGMWIKVEYEGKVMWILSNLVWP